MDHPRHQEKKDMDAPMIQMTPTATVSRMIDLLSAERLGVDGYSQRCAYLAKEQLDELVRDLLSNGQMMAWATAQEDVDLRAMCESRFA